MKVLLTGGRGMLGRTICEELADFEIVATDIPEADITDENVIDAVLEEHRPDAVIHCAAMTAVDKCEQEVDLAYRLNARGTANVAAACNRQGVRLIAISTDYVFDGDSDRPYNEFDAATGGRTEYGKSKFAGEEQVRALCPDHVICRISWLYGKGSTWRMDRARSSRSWPTSTETRQARTRWRGSSAQSCCVRSSGAPST